ncbi:MAG: DUF2065 domain-containing protein [Piscirickettsiaceae bacterium]|nr:DUF2065 domain-containing protein [Piscirickettsiaceae bacterium]
MNNTLIHSLWLAAALMLVIEGLIPFLSPAAFRRTLAKMAKMNDQQLRIMGLFSMVFGLVLLYWVN